jgi:hypothetical protein
LADTLFGEFCSCFLLANTIMVKFPVILPLVDTNQSDVPPISRLPKQSFYHFFKQTFHEMFSPKSSHRLTQFYNYYSNYLIIFWLYMVHTIYLQVSVLVLAQSEYNQEIRC